MGVWPYPNTFGDRWGLTTPLLVLGVFSKQNFRELLLSGQELLQNEIYSFAHIVLHFFHRFTQLMPLMLMRFGLDCTSEYWALVGFACLCLAMVVQTNIDPDNLMSLAI